VKTTKKAKKKVAEPLVKADVIAALRVRTDLRAGVAGTDPSGPRPMDPPPK
jgi:hypothetical protein